MSRRAQTRCRAEIASQVARLAFAEAAELSGTVVRVDCDGSAVVSASHGVVSSSIASTSPSPCSEKAASASLSARSRPDHAVGEPVELLPQLVVGEPVARGAARVIDPRLHRLAVVGERGGPGLGVRDVGIRDDLDPRHQVADIRRVTAVSENSASPALPSSSAMEHANVTENLPSKPVRGSVFPVSSSTSGCTRSLILSMRSAVEPVTDGEVADRVDGRVDHHAARVRLHPVVEDLPPLPEPVDQIGGRARRRHHREHAAAALQRVRRSGESTGREQPRPHARRGGVAGVERFCHRAELLAVARRLRRRDAQAVGRGDSGRGRAA